MKRIRIFRSVDIAKRPITYLMIGKQPIRLDPAVNEDYAVDTVNAALVAAEKRGLDRALKIAQAALASSRGSSDEFLSGCVLVRDHISAAVGEVQK